MGVIMTWTDHMSSSLKAEFAIFKIVSIFSFYVFPNLLQMTKNLLGKKQGTTLECPGPEIQSVGVNRRGGTT